MKRFPRLPSPLAPVVLATLAALLTLGCSGLSGNNSADAGPAPVITSTSFPPTASIGSDGNYDFPGLISFSSPTSPVNFIQVTSNALMYSNTLTIEPVTSVHNGSLPLTFPASSAASGTQADYSITLVDEAGAQSDPAAGTVLLE
jgi:hypothetical protein